MTDADFYRENGYLHARGIFDSVDVEDMRAAIERILASVAGTEHDENHTWQAVAQDAVLKGFHNVQYHDAAFTRTATHPRLVAILVELVGPNVQLHHTKMLVKPPERGAPFPMHQDYPYFPHSRHTMLAASVHLDDADEENGCLHVVPGSHRLGPLDTSDDGSHHLAGDYPLEAGMPIPARAGDVVFFNYLTIHGSGVNRSTRPRRNVLFQYRDRADRPLGAEHVNWGQGLMVCGVDRTFHTTRPRFRLEEPAIVQATS